MENFIKSNYSLEDISKVRDENGFIDLSNFGIILTEESREKKGTAERFKNWVDFNGEKVLLRGNAVENYSIYAELIVEEICKQIGIEAAHYDLIKIKDENGNEKIGVLSQAIVDFDKEYLTSLHDIIGEEPAPETIDDSIDYISTTKYNFTIDRLQKAFEQAGYTEEEIRKILLEYKERLLFYIVVMDTDKHPENISFVVDKKGEKKLRLSANYDSEFSLMLERDKEMAEYYSDNLDELKLETDLQDPKIGIIVKKENGGFDVMWRDTLATLFEDDDLSDYYFDKINGKIDIDKALESVEERINSKLPDVVKKIVINSFKIRNNMVEKIANYDLEYETESEGIELNESGSILGKIVGESQSTTFYGDLLKLGKMFEKWQEDEKDFLRESNDWDEK